VSMMLCAYSRGIVMLRVSYSLYGFAGMFYWAKGSDVAKTLAGDRLRSLARFTGSR